MVRMRVCSTLGDLLQQPVAGLVAAGVVDHLELVEIEVQQHVRRAIVALRAASSASLSAILELAAVDEAGQRVVARLIGQRALQPAFLAHVVEHHDGADEPAAAVADRRRGVLDRDLLAAAVDEHDCSAIVDHAPFAQAARRPGSSNGCARRLVDEAE